MKRILLTGAGGQVGWELRRTLLPLGEVVAADRALLDLSRPQDVEDFVRKMRPDWIVNAAAYTAVDRAQSERAVCHAINAVAPGVLAKSAQEVGAALIHLSTDYVFDGAKGSPYVETDAPRPLNYYGQSKLEGEQAIQASHDRYAILRTSWVYGGHGANFVRTMQRLFREKPVVGVVDDQIGAPTWSRAIAESIAALIARCDGPEALVDHGGLYHLSCAGATSWYGFARRIHEKMARIPELPLARLEPIATESYPTPAARSPYSVLDNGKLAQRFGIALPSWDTCFDLAAEEFGLE